MHGREATDVWLVKHERDNNTTTNSWEGANNGGGAG